MATIIKKQQTEEELALEMEEYVKKLRERMLTEKETVREEAREALIRTGVLNSDGTMKNRIVTWE